MLDLVSTFFCSFANTYECAAYLRLAVRHTMATFLLHSTRGARFEWMNWRGRRDERGRVLLVAFKNSFPICLAEVS
jgi:hypothetical protein